MRQGLVAKEKISVFYYSSPKGMDAPNDRSTPRRLGSTHLDADGKIYVQIDDARGASKAIWLEELAHARPCMLDGSPEASSDMAQICDREIEVHQCLLANASRLKLTPTEIAECEAQLRYYTEMKNDKRRRR